MAALPVEGMSPDIAQAFMKLRERFVLGLPARWEAILASQGDTLVQELHRMAGAAGSFGFEAIGLAARRAEEQARVAPQDAPQAMEALRSLVMSAVSETSGTPHASGHPTDTKP